LFFRRFSLFSHIYAAVGHLYLDLPVSYPRLPYPPEAYTQGGEFARLLGKRGVRRASFANRAVQVANDLDEIIKAIEVYAS